MSRTRFITRQFIVFTCLSIALVANLAGNAYAGPSYSASVGFYQGFDLEQGIALESLEMLLQQGAEDETSLRIVFVSEEITPEDNPYSFSPTVDFYMGFDIDFTGIVPTDSATLAIVENTTFEAVDAKAMNRLEFGDIPADIQLNPNTTIVLLTADDIFYKIGNFSVSETGVSFSYQQFDYAEIETIDSQSPVPEPSTIILLGAGLIGVAGMIRRKQQHTNQ